MFDRSIIDKYEQGGDKLQQAVSGLTREDLLCVPPADAKVGLWTIQQVVIHLMDSDLIAADRMKRVIAEENPTLIGFDENKFAQNLFMNEQSAEDAVTIVDLNRKNFVRVLRKLPDSAWDRVGTHNERGRVTLGGLLKDYTAHLDRHVDFIHKKRKLMGKEMW
jgi:hypothetical protein